MSKMSADPRCIYNIKTGIQTVVNLHKCTNNGIDTNHPYDSSISGELKRFDASPVQDAKHRPQQHYVEKSHESKEERHVDSALVLDPNLEHDGVAAIKHGRQQCQKIAPQR